MANEGDVEKLKKQIEVLSSLIHTQKELRRKDTSVNELQNTVNYSWKKNSIENKLSGKKITRSEPSREHSSKSTKNLSSNRQKLVNVGEVNVNTSTLNNIPRTQSTGAYKDMKFSLKSKRNFKLPKPSMSIETTCREPAVLSRIFKDTEHSKMLKNEKEKIKKEGLLGANTQRPANGKTSAASTSLLSARLSSLSSSLAAAKLKLNLTAGKNAISKSPTTLPSTTMNSCSKLLPSSSTSSPSLSKEDKARTPLSSSAYKWKKSQSLEPGTSNSFQIDKLSASSMKWTNPDINKDKDKLKTSGVTTHVWGSQHSLKLDRRKRSLISKESNHHGYPKGFLTRRQKVVLKDAPKKAVISRYSLVNRKRKRSMKAQKNNKVVVIEGVPYRSSANKLQKTNQHAATVKKRPSLTLDVRGEKFLMDGAGKTLTRIKAEQSSRTKDSQRVTTSSSSFQVGSKGKQPKRRSSVGKISIGGVTFVQTAPGVLIRSNEAVSTKIASKVIRRSIQNAILFKYRKNVKLKSRQYCMFYNRFGKCNNGENCPYIHDPSKIAVCTKFLQGKCKNTDGSCSFSHKIDKDKMPVCHFFLKGTCINDDCPYSHVNVSSKAGVCQDFIKGYCLNGQQCKKKHILNCEEFSLTGKCSNGRKCKLIHRQRKAKKRKRKPSASRETKEATLELMTEEDGFLPLEQMDVLTEQDLSRSEVVTPKPQEPISIKPRFLTNKEQQG